MQIRAPSHKHFLQAPHNSSEIVEKSEERGKSGEMGKNGRKIGRKKKQREGKREIRMIEGIAGERQ